MKGARNVNRKKRKQKIHDDSRLETTFASNCFCCFCKGVSDSGGPRRSGGGRAAKKKRDSGPGSRVATISPE